MPSRAATAAVPSTPMVDRALNLVIRVSEDERAMLAALAEREGISSSDFVRLYIRRAYREAFGAPRSSAEAMKLHQVRAESAAAAPFLDAVAAPPPPKPAKKKTKATK